MSFWKKLGAGTVIGGFVAYKSLQSLLGIPEESTPIPPDAKPAIVNSVAQTPLESVIHNSDGSFSESESEVLPERVLSEDEKLERRVQALSDHLVRLKDEQIRFNTAFIDAYRNLSTQDFAKFLSDKRDEIKKKYDSTLAGDLIIDGHSLKKLAAYGSVSEFISKYSGEISLSSLIGILTLDEGFSLEKSKLVSYALSFLGPPSEPWFDDLDNKWKPFYDSAKGKWINRDDEGNLFETVFVESPAEVDKRRYNSLLVYENILPASLSDEFVNLSYKRLSSELLEISGKVWVADAVEPDEKKQKADFNTDLEYSAVNTIMSYVRNLNDFDKSYVKSFELISSLSEVSRFDLAVKKKVADCFRKAYRLDEENHFLSPSFDYMYTRLEEALRE